MKPQDAGMAAPAANRRVIVWFRRDLRLADNPALAAALRMAPEVIPVYVWAPEEEGQFQPGRCSRWWLHHSLKALERDLAALGCRMLYYRSADSRALLARLATQLGAQAVLFNHLYDPISMVRDNEVKSGLTAAGIFCQSFNADILREPWEVLDPCGKPFTCYDSFWAAHCALPYPPSPPLPIPSALPPLPAGLEIEVGSLTLPELGIMSAEEEMSNAQLEFHWQPGSAGAHMLLDEFVRSGRLAAFSRDRAKADRASTSRLSPHIHYGEVSVRHMHYVVKQQEAACGQSGDPNSSFAHFLRQLGYREYSRYLSFHFPFTHERSLLEHLRAVPWRFDQRLFKAWRQGRTGYPLVDAAMREVWGTGWMHNRMRVVAACFMVKNLLLPWQWGLKHYWDALLDADLECDALGWQYVAGCMADAHDFSSIIDHTTEAKRFDPEGHYVRRWLPVLARLPAKYIHQPWLAPESVLEDAGVELGVNYPYPVIGVEESMASLAAANAVVQQCQRKSIGVSGVGAGPFRPATDAEPEEAERLFDENYRMELLYGPSVPAAKAAAKAAAAAATAEGCGTTEDVQSCAVMGEEEADLVSVCQPEACSSRRAAKPAAGSVAASPPRGGWDAVDAAHAMHAETAMQQAEAAPSGTPTLTNTAAHAAATTGGAVSAPQQGSCRQGQGRLRHTGKRPAEDSSCMAPAAAVPASAGTRVAAAPDAAPVPVPAQAGAAAAAAAAECEAMWGGDCRMEDVSAPMDHGPAVIQVPGWQAFTTAQPIAAASIAAGSGSGHPSMSGAAAALVSGASPALVPLSLSRQLPAPLAIARQPPALLRLLPAAYGSTQHAPQGSSSPACGSPGGGMCGIKATAGAAASVDTADQRWPPALCKLKQAVAACGSGAAAGQESSAAAGAPGSLKRLRGRSPSPAPAS